MDSYCIYCHINKINQKKYIGQTKDYSKRCQAANYKGCTKFYNAIQKYGWENFEHLILETGLTLEEANKKEQYYIQKYNTILEGYNLKTGGLNCEYSIESKNKMSQSSKSKERILCVETGQIYDSAKEIERLLGYANANIIACCQNRLITAYGFHWQYLDKIPNSGPRRDKRKKGVYCIELNKKFESASWAARELNISRPNISNCCAGKLNTAGGYHWSFLEEE